MATQSWQAATTACASPRKASNVAFVVGTWLARSSAVSRCRVGRVAVAQLGLNLGAVQVEDGLALVACGKLDSRGKARGRPQPGRPDAAPRSLQSAAGRSVDAPRRRKRPAVCHRHRRRQSPLRAMQWPTNGSPVRLPWRDTHRRAPRHRISWPECWRTRRRQSPARPGMLQSLRARLPCHSCWADKPRRLPCTGDRQG